MEADAEFQANSPQMESSAVEGSSSSTSTPHQRKTSPHKESKAGISLPAKKESKPFASSSTVRNTTKSPAKAATARQPWSSSSNLNSPSRVHASKVSPGSVQSSRETSTMGSRKAKTTLTYETRSKSGVKQSSELPVQRTLNTAPARVPSLQSSPSLAARNAGSRQHKDLPGQRPSPSRKPPLSPRRTQKRSEPSSASQDLGKRSSVDIAIKSPQRAQRQTTEDEDDASAETSQDDSWLERQIERATPYGNIDSRIGNGHNDSSDARSESEIAEDDVCVIISMLSLPS